jgi:hypothetical protein
MLEKISGIEEIIIDDDEKYIFRNKRLERTV